MLNFHLCSISYWHRVLTDDTVLLSRIEVLPATDRPPTTLSHSVRLKSGKADVFIFGYPVPSNICAKLLPNNEEEKLRETIDSLHVCPGIVFFGRAT